MSRYARALLHKLGEDVSESTATRTAVVVAPHQDDETLGCGVTILRKAEAGTRVWVVFAADGRHSHRSSHLTPDELAQIREGESIEACRRLGVPRPRVHHLRLEETRLAEQRPALTHGIRGVLDAVEPDEVYLPCLMDAHPDHRAVAEAVIDVAVDRAMDRVRPCMLYEYPVWLWAWPWWKVWAGRGALSLMDRPWRARSAVRRPRPVLVRTAGYLDRKRSALLAHASQMRRLTGEPDWSTLAEVDGGRFLPRFFEEHEVFFPLHDPMFVQGQR